MAGWNRIEDIIVWQLSREICQDIWLITRDNKFSLDTGLVRQMLNSSGSMMDNVAEGFERGSNAEFRTFLGYAKGSAGELRSQLLRAVDRDMIPTSKAADIQHKVIRFSKQVRSLILNLKDNREVRGFRLDR